MIQGVGVQPPHPHRAGPHHGLMADRQGRGGPIRICQALRPLVHLRSDLGPLAGKGLGRAGLRQPLQGLALVECQFNYVEFSGLNVGGVVRGMISLDHAVQT